MLAFRKLKAVRPTWMEGQPRWTAGKSLFCANELCAKPLRPDSEAIYCSKHCRDSQHSRQYEARTPPEKKRDRERLANERWAAKQEPRDCPGCSGQFQPKFRDKPNYVQKYCDHHCYCLARKKAKALSMSALCQ
jgi:hypothetical protein